MKTYLLLNNEKIEIDPYLVPYLYYLYTESENWPLYIEKDGKREPYLIKRIDTVLRQEGKSTDADFEVILK